MIREHNRKAQMKHALLTLAIVVFLAATVASMIGGWTWDESLAAGSSVTATQFGW
jgi:FlaG/FlaF family flagellin (archaellin)